MQKKSEFRETFDIKQKSYTHTPLVRSPRACSSYKASNINISKQEIKWFDGAMIQHINFSFETKVYT